MTERNSGRREKKRRCKTNKFNRVSLVLLTELTSDVCTEPKGDKKIYKNKSPHHQTTTSVFVLCYRAMLQPAGPQLIRAQEGESIMKGVSIMFTRTLESQSHSGTDDIGNEVCMEHN